MFIRFNVKSFIIRLAAMLVSLPESSCAEGLGVRVAAATALLVRLLPYEP